MQSSVTQHNSEICAGVHSVISYEEIQQLKADTEKILQRPDIAVTSKYVIGVDKSSLTFRLYVGLCSNNAVEMTGKHCGVFILIQRHAPECKSNATASSLRMPRSHPQLPTDIPKVS